MKTNVYIVALASIISAGICILLWGIAFGAAFDIPVFFSEQMVEPVSRMLAAYPALSPTGGWARFYVAIIAFMLPMLVLSMLAGFKAWLLPRNVGLQQAWDMEMEKAYRNTWRLWADLRGNYTR